MPPLWYPPQGTPWELFELVARGYMPLNYEFKPSQRIKDAERIVDDRERGTCISLNLSLTLLIFQ